ncbi:Gle1, partial [Thalictrum thalictroides]
MLQAPLAMDLLLAEFHKACIFTVPKYVVKSQSGLSKEAYLKLLGYREEDGKLETEDKYLGRVESCMKLYGALVQTEINGVRNLHGLEEGWAWLARFLNFLPANIYTAVALEAFIKMAGFALFRRYKSQFKKILNLISQHFVSALEERGDSNLNPIIMKLKFYIDTNQYCKEPEGWRIETSLLSEIVEPEPNP